MKNSSATSAAASASKFLKNIISMLSSIAKAKSMAIRDKTNAFKTRLAVVSLLRNKKFSLGSITHKIQAILNHKHEDHGLGQDDDEGVEDQSKAVVLYNASVPSSSTNHDHYSYYYNSYEEEDADDADKYPDLRHCLFDEEEDKDELDLGDPNGSVIDLMRNSKEEGEDFNLEDEIDHAADLFIMKFHKRMRLQKLESFKRYLQRTT